MRPFPVRPNRERGKRESNTCVKIIEKQDGEENLGFKNKNAETTTPLSSL